MEERLKKLKKAMNQTTFDELSFTDKHRTNIHQEIQKHQEKDEDLLLAVMQLLIHEKTGYELAKLLRGRGIKKFENNEGLLYTVLHRFEQKGYLNSSWNDLEGKLYKLSKRGKKLLVQTEKSGSEKQAALKLWLEVSL